MKSGTAALVLVLAGAPAAAANESGVQRAVGATVIVSTSTGVGAGVHIGDGLIVTAAHVADEASVSISNDDFSGRGTVTAVDEDRDLALISSPNARQLPAASLRTTAAVVGEKVFAAGAPMQSYIQLTAGIVSAEVEQEGVERVQTDAPVNPGNSGGPLLDQDGQILGIVVTKSADDEGIGWATAASEVNDFLGSADVIRSGGTETLEPAPSSGAQPSGAQPSGAQPSGAQPSGTQPSGTQPSGSVSVQTYRTAAPVVGATALAALALGAGISRRARRRERAMPLLDLTDI